ncbi:MAG: hypothetical protein L6R36_008413, partial [Xanthoria steineri]
MVLETPRGQTHWRVLLTSVLNDNRPGAVTWSAVETGSTSTTDNGGHPTMIPAPFYVCKDPLCANTGCILAVLCSAGNAVTGFGGFPPPSPPPDPAKEPDDSPTGSRSQSQELHHLHLLARPELVLPLPQLPTLDRHLLRMMLVRAGVAVGWRLTTPVNIPSYSSYSRAMNLNKQPNANGGTNAKIYDAIQKWYAESIEIDGTRFFGSNLENPFDDITGPRGIDHVWEKSNVGDFLGSLLGSDFDCDHMNSLFSACGVKLQKIFDQLPSMDPNNVQTGFAAMNKNLNGMKGWMFSQKFADARFGKIYDTDAKIIQGLKRQAIIFDWFNSDSGIQSLHDETNN